MNESGNKKDISAETVPALRNIQRLSLERLREVLAYDPKTGLFIWRKRLSPRCKLDQPAGDVKADGYRKIVIDKVSYHASHLAWFHYYGERPSRLIDHENTVLAPYADLVPERDHRP